MPYNTDLPIPCQSSVVPSLDHCPPNPENGGAVCPDARRTDGIAVSPLGATPISCPPQLVNFGFDTIHINFWIDWSRSWKFGLFQALKEAKIGLQSGMEEMLPFHMGKSEIFSFNLHRIGSRYQKYRLSTGDVSMYLDPRDHHAVNPNMVLQIGSLSSNQDPVSFVSQFVHWINYLGGVVVKQDVTRVDICADFKIGINDSQIFSIERWITRAMKHSFDGSNRENSGVTIGRGDILLRAYDKQKEMREKQAIEKMLFFNSRWNTLPSDPVTRFEFQLRGKSLKEMFSGEKPLVLLSMNISEIWAYLTEKWFRLSEKPVDRENNNQSHSKVSSFWENIQKASLVLVAPIVRNRKQKHINIPALKKQIAGCLLTVCAGVGHSVDDIFGMLCTSRDIIQETVSDLFQNATFKHRYLSKQISSVVSF